MVLPPFSSDKWLLGVCHPAGCRLTVPLIPRRSHEKNTTQDSDMIMGILHDMKYYKFCSSYSTGRLFMEKTELSLSMQTTATFCDG